MHQLAIELSDLPLEILEMLVQPLEDRDKPGRQSVVAEKLRQSHNAGLAGRQADAELKQETMHLVDRSRSIPHHSFTNAR